MSRKHRQIQKWLAVYDDLTATEQARVQAHIQTCPECTTRFAAYRQMDRDLAALAKPGPQPSLRTAFQAKLDDEVRRRRRLFRLVSGWQRLPQLAGQTLALALLAGLVGMMWLSLRQQSYQPVALIPANKPTTVPTATPLPTSTPIPTATPLPVWTAVPQPTIQSGRSVIESLAVSVDGQTAAVGDGSRYVQLWQLSTGEQSRYWSMPYNTAASLALSPDGRWLAAGSLDYEGYVMLWSTNGEAAEQRLDEPTYTVTALAFSPDSTLLAAGTGRDDGHVYLWQTTNHELLTTLEPKQDVAAMAFSPDGRYLVTGSVDGQVQVWQAADGRERAAPSALTEAITVIAFSPDGQTAVIGTDDGTLQLYTMPDMTLLQTLDGETAVQTAAFSADGMLLAAVSSDGQIRLWQLADNSPTLLFSTEVDAPARFQSKLVFTNDHLKVVAAYYDGRIQIWHIQSE